jgi:hypothetical protein
VTLGRSGGRYLCGGKSGGGYLCEGRSARRAVGNGRRLIPLSISLLVDGHVCLKHAHGVTEQAALEVAPFPPHLLGFSLVSRLVLNV